MSHALPTAGTVAVFATKGVDTNEDQRIRELTAPLRPAHWSFDRSSKPRTALRLMRRLARERPSLVVMEGTSVAGGVALMVGRRVFGVPYVVSSGDAVAPFLGLYGRVPGAFGAVYERLLYANSAGFIGWTPYLVGRALTLGAPRAVTAENWAATEADDGGRERVRRSLGLAPDDVVIGLVGALNWSSRREYCYGLELVRAVRAVERDDVKVVVVGDGDGRDRLQSEAGHELGRRVILPGAVSHEEVPAYLAAFDAGSLPQSLDGVGSFRYTTKISEYAAAGLPIVTGRLPFAYDLDEGWFWRLEGEAPWSPVYTSALARWMQQITADELRERRSAIRIPPGLFDRSAQTDRVTAFIAELIEDL